MNLAYKNIRIQTIILNPPLMTIVLQELRDLGKAGSKN
jgi:hypothetical protein